MIILSFNSSKLTWKEKRHLPLGKLFKDSGVKLLELLSIWVALATCALPSKPNFTAVSRWLLLLVCLVILLVRCLRAWKLALDKVPSTFLDKLVVSHYFLENHSTLNGVRWNTSVPISCSSHPFLQKAEFKINCSLCSWWQLLSRRNTTSEWGQVNQQK